MKIEPWRRTDIPSSLWVQTLLQPISICRRRSSMPSSPRRSNSMGVCSPEVALGFLRGLSDWVSVDFGSEGIEQQWRKYVAQTLKIHSCECL
jgi:hypothetical protein